MSSIDLGGIRLSDNDGKILNGAFLTAPIGGETRTSSFKGDEKLFVGVLPAGNSESAKNEAILLEVQDGEVSYSTTPGQINIRGTFYATQPNNLAQNKRLIYKGSLVLPIKTLKDEDRTKGYTITSLASASNASDDLYLDPKRGLTFSSGGTKSKPSLRVDGEWVLKNSLASLGVELFGSLGANVIINYSATGRTEQEKTVLNIGRTITFPIPFLKSYELAVEKADVQFGIFDSNSSNALRLGGEFKLQRKKEPGGPDPKKEPGGKLKILSPENFMQFGGGNGFQLKGSFELNNLPIPPIFLVKKASAKGNTKDFSTFELAADIGFAFNPLQAFAAAQDDDPKKTFGGSISLFEGKFDGITINSRGLKIPLGTTPYLVTALGGGVKDIANPSVPTRVILQTSLASISKKFGDDPDIKGDVDGEFTLRSLGIKGKAELFPGFKLNALDIKGFAEAEGNLSLQWSKGILSGNTKLNVMNDFLKGRMDFAADTNLNFGFKTELDVNVPRTIPLIGGKNLGQVGAGIQYINDDTFSNDFAAAWFSLNLFFDRIQIGAKVVFDGTFKSLGADSIAETRGTLDNTIGLIAKGDLAKSISTKTLKSPDQPPQSKRFLPVRFDRSEFNFIDNRPGRNGRNDRLDIFEPIAMASGFEAERGLPFALTTRTQSRSVTKNNKRYRLPLDAVFLSDVATLIPELTTPESSFYVVDLDKFKQKTGEEFGGFAKVAPEVNQLEQFYGFVNSRGILFSVFDLNGELFKITESPDVTLKEFKPKALDSQPLAKAGGASPNLFSMLTVDRGNKVDIAYDASDPDSEANITLYYDSDGTGANGIFIADRLKEKDGTDTYTWDTRDVPTGIYYIYAVIDDGDNVPVVSYLPDPIRILDPNVLPQVQGVTGRWSGADTVELSWEPMPDLGLGYYVVSYTAIASGDLNQEESSGTFTISNESNIRLTGLKTGDDYRITVKAVNDAGEEGLPSEPIEILVGDHYTATLEKGEWELNTHPSSEYVADLDLNQDQKAVLLRGPAGASIKDGRFIWEVPVNAKLGIYDVSIQIRDVFGNESVVDRRLDVNDRETSARLLQANNSVFTVQGTNAKLEVTAIAPSSSKFVNELGVFKVDDAEGRIDGLQPLDAGYLAAAVKRSQVVFSVLTDNPPAFDKSDYSRSISFADDTNVRFLLVKDGSLDDVRDGQVPLSSVLLPAANTNTNTKVGNGQFKLQWEDGSGDPTDFKDLVVQIKATDRSLLLGEAPQTQTYELFDFTDVTVPGAKIEADLVIYQSLAFDNVLGFYEVLNTEGAILDALTGQVLQPGTDGYETAAVRQRVASFDVVVNRVTDTQGIINVRSEFSAGKQYAPFVIVNGLAEQLLDTNTDNNPEIYFPYLGSSTDSFDRFRLLGQNVFAFEDWSDKDFNDIVIKSQFSVLA